MCGIAGIFHNSSSEKYQEVLSRMVKSISHRGPDSNGFYFSNCISLGHSRLSILDLSSAGNQPMTFENLTITLNGGVYNFKEIRKILENNNYTFKSYWHDYFVNFIKIKK
jgi:asparagine synthase (glutamine-hydrolysing)